jgi:hypothetical protein
MGGAYEEVIRNVFVTKILLINTFTIMKNFIVQAKLISPILQWHMKKVYKLETECFATGWGKDSRGKEFFSALHFL